MKMPMMPDDTVSGGVLGGSMPYDDPEADENEVS